MSNSLIFPVATVLLAALVVLGVRLYFGQGLAHRLFAAMIPLLAVVALAGYFIGLYPSPEMIAAIAAVGTVVAVSALLGVYRSVVVRLDGLTEAVRRSTGQLAVIAKETAATAAQQSATVAEVNTTVSELTETSRAAATFAREVVDTSAMALKKGEDGVQFLEEAREVLALIEKVNEVVEAVRDFAAQSHLLAINARVEAAKAGDHGRGFAVVASEIRTLAEQSRESSQRIWATLGRTEQGRTALEKAASSVQALLAVLNDNSDKARQIAATAAQQSAGISQISQAMENVAAGGEASAEATRTVETALADMDLVSAELAAYVRGEGAQPRSRR